MARSNPAAARIAGKPRIRIRLLPRPYSGLLPAERREAGPDHHPRPRVCFTDWAMI